MMDFRIVPPERANLTSTYGFAVLISMQRMRPVILPRPLGDSYGLPLAVM